MDTEYLSGIGRIWSKDDYPKDIVPDERYLTAQKSVTKVLAGQKRGSVVITGDRGVGKSTLIDMVCKTLGSQNWTIFIATASELMAGQKYIGELEGRVQNILRELKSKKNSLWVIPNFHETYYVGRTDLDPLGILDQILSTLDRGEVLILGESSTHQYEKVLVKKPLLRSAVNRIMIHPSDSAFSDQLAHKWTQIHPNKHLWSNLTQEDVKEVGNLARQFLPKQEEPGILFEFLRNTNSYFENEPPKKGFEIRAFPGKPFLLYRIPSGVVG